MTVSTGIRDVENQSARQNLTFGLDDTRQNLLINDGQMNAADYGRTSAF